MILKKLLYITLLFFIVSPFILAEGKYETPTQLVVQKGFSIGAGVDITKDGRFFLTWNMDNNQIQLWTRDGSLLRTIESGFSNHWAVSFSPCGNYLACIGSVDSNQTIEIWNLYGLKQKTISLPADLQYQLWDMIYSPDGKLLAGRGSVYNEEEGYSYNIILIQNVENNINKIIKLPFSNNAPTNVAFSPDSKKIACGFDNKIGIWTIDGKQETIIEDSALPEHSSILKLAFSPLGTQLAASYYIHESDIIPSFDYGMEDYYNHIKLWNIDGTLDRVVEKQVGNVEQMTFNPADRLVCAIRNTRQTSFDGETVTIFMDGFINIYDKNGVFLKTLQGDLGTVLDLACDSNGTIAAGCMLGVEFWNQAGKKLNTIKSTDVYYQSLSVSADGKYIMAGGDDLATWSRDGRLLNKFSLPQENTFNYQAVYTEDGNLLLIHHNGFEILDNQTGEVLYSHEKRGNWTKTALTISTNGKYIVTASTDTDLEEFSYDLWDTRGNKISHLDCNGSAICISGDGKLIACYQDYDPYYGSAGQDVIIMDQQGTQIGAIDSVGFIPYGMAIDNDGTIVIGGTDFVDDTRRMIAIWNREGKFIKQIDLAPSYRYQPQNIIFSPDGKYFTASGEKQVKLWDKAGNLLKTFTGHALPVNDLAFTPDQKHLISVARDNTIRIWNIENGESAILVSYGDEWIIYTDDGYFDSSREGGKLLAMFNGLQIFPVDQFALQHNRPDIIMRRLNLASEQEINYFFIQYLKRLVKLDVIPQQISINTFESQILKRINNENDYNLLNQNYTKIGEQYKLTVDLTRPDKFRLLSIPCFLHYVERLMQSGTHVPEVEILSAQQQGKYYNLNFEISDPIYEISCYNIYVNGVPLYKSPGKTISSQTRVITEQIELNAGSNIIEVTCINSLFVESLRQRMTVEYDVKPEENLYFIGFAVTSYKDPRLNLVYPQKDASDMENILASMSHYYKNVYTFTYTNQHCTRQNIEKAKNHLSRAGVDDTVVLFISGHGIHDNDINSTYYYLTYETDITNLSQTAANFNLLEDILDGINPRKKLFLMDTCESGEYDETELTSIVGRTEELGFTARTIRGLTVNKKQEQSGQPRPYLLERERFINNDIFRRTGAVVFSSSKGGEFSYEPITRTEQGNGFFTGAVLKTLYSPIADINGDEFISLAELYAYVIHTVSEQTDHLQNPTIDRDNIYQKFGLPLIPDYLDNAATSDLNYYLAYVINTGDAKRVKQLLKRGACLNQEDLTKAMLSSAAAGYYELVQLLLEEGAPPCAKDVLGVSAIEMAAKSGNKKIVLSLLQKGIPIPTRLLIYAEENDYLDDIIVYIKEGCPIETQNRQLVFWLSISRGYKQVVALLLQAGVDTQEEGFGGLTPARAAEEWGYPDIANLIKAYE